MRWRREYGTKNCKRAKLPYLIRGKRRSQAAVAKFQKKTEKSGEGKSEEVEDNE